MAEAQAHGTRIKGSGAFMSQRGTVKSRPQGYAPLSQPVSRILRVHSGDERQCPRLVVAGKDLEAHIPQRLLAELPLAALPLKDPPRP